MLDALTAKPRLEVEGEDARIDSRMLRDERVQREGERSIFDVKDADHRLG